MRLTCPTCGARYDVDDDLIASRGQHVQCTACNTRWFERPPASTATGPLAEDEIIARLEARGRQGALPGGTDRGPSPRPRPSGDVPGEGRADATVGAAAPHLRLVEGAPQEDEPAAAAPSDASPSEPAASEAPDGDDASNALRAADSKDAEVEPAGPEVATPEEPPHAPQAPEPENPAETGIRRRLELERPAAAWQDAEAPPASASRRRAPGLALALFVLALLAAVYFAAGDLAQAVPALEPALGAYAGAVDQARAAIGSGLGLGEESD